MNTPFVSSPDFFPMMKVPIKTEKCQYGANYGQQRKKKGH